MAKKTVLVQQQSPQAENFAGAGENKIKIVPPVVARTDNQRVVIETILQNTLTLVLGPSGVGKTFLPVGLGANYLYKEKVKEIIFIRPMIEATREEVGFLPGNIAEKSFPYTLPLYDELSYFYDQAGVRELQKQGKLRTVLLAHARGLTFKNAFVICDEMQNASFDQIKLLLTRIGEGTKMVMSGDLTQSDLPCKKQGGLERIYEKLTEMDGVGRCKLTTEDIIRSGFVSRLLERLSE